MNWLEKHWALSTFGQRLSDYVAKGIGLLTFIILQTIFVIAWMALNLIGCIKTLGCVSVYFTPIYCFQHKQLMRLPIIMAQK